MSTAQTTRAVPTREELAAYIQERAPLVGIDPSVALRVAESEGLNADPNEAWQSKVVKNGKRERSYGPFQLYIDGGLGNQFMKDTGLDPRDPSTAKQQVDYALNHAKDNGWGAWYGAANTGIGNFDGISGEARPKLSYDTSVAPEDRQGIFKEGSTLGQFINQMGERTEELRMPITDTAAKFDSILDLSQRMVTNPSNAPLGMVGGTQLGNPTGAMPKGMPTAGATLPNGQPLPGSQPTPTVSTNNAAPNAPAAAAPNAAPDQERMSDRILAKLYPNSEPEDRRRRAGDALQMLSRGLGQMSQGQAVDLSGVFDRMQRRQTSIAANAQKQRELDLDTTYKYQQLKVQQGQLGVAQQKANLDALVAQAEMDPSSGAFTPAQIENFMNDPQLRVMASGLLSPDADVRGVATKEIYDEMARRREELAESNPQLGDLYDAFQAGDDAAISKILNSGNVDSAGLNSVMDLAGVGNTSEMLNSKFYKDALENNPELARAIERRLTRASGMGMTAEQAANRDYANAKREEFSQSTNDSRRNIASLNAIERSTLDIMDNPEVNDKGAWSALYQKVASAAHSISPGLGDYVEDAFNMDLAAEQNIASGASSLALMIARPLMKGQGTVTEGEREALMRTIASQELTPELRLEVIEQIRMLDKLDRASGDRYRQGILDSEDHSNARTLYEDVTADAADVTGELVRSARAAAKYRHVGRSDKFAEQVAGIDASGDPYARHEDAAPRLTRSQYNMNRDLVPLYKDDAGNGVRIWIEVDPATGSEKYMQEVNGNISVVTQ